MTTAQTPTCRVSYPSGTDIEIAAVGFMRVVIEEAQYAVPVIVSPDGQNIILDPRAIVVDVASGKRLYRPRANRDLLPAWANRWLNDHPQWDAAD